MTTFNKSFYHNVRTSIANKGAKQRFIWRGLPTIVDNQSTLHDARVLHLIQTIRGKYALPPAPLLVRPDAYTHQPNMTLQNALEFARDQKSIVLCPLSPLAQDLVPIAPSDKESDLIRLKHTAHGTYPKSRWDAALADINQLEQREGELSKIHNAWRRARPNHWTPHISDMVFNLESLDDDNNVTAEIGYITFPKNGMGATVRRIFNRERFNGQLFVTTQYTVQPFYIVDGTPMRMEHTPHPHLSSFAHDTNGIYHLNTNDSVNRLLSALWDLPRHSAAPPADHILTHDQSTFRIKRDRFKTRRPREQLSLNF